RRLDARSRIQRMPKSPEPGVRLNDAEFYTPAKCNSERHSLRGSRPRERLRFRTGFQICAQGLAVDHQSQMRHILRRQHLHREGQIGLGRIGRKKGLGHVRGPIKEVQESGSDGELLARRWNVFTARWNEKLLQTGVVKLPEAAIV